MDLSNDPKRYTLFLKLLTPSNLLPAGNLYFPTAQMKKDGISRLFSYTLAMRTTSRAIITSSFVGIINTLTGECG